MIIEDNKSLAKALKQVKQASMAMALATSAQKHALLEAIAKELQQQQPAILQANQQDCHAALESGLQECFIDRLALANRLEGIISDVRTVAALPDPIGVPYDKQTLPNGLLVHKQRVPLGVIGVIYEARPNVTVEVSCLALKSGNAIVLRGGKEAMHTNRALAQAIHQALANCQFPTDALAFVATENRALLKDLLMMHEYIDLIVPRGGGQLHQFCRENSNIAVIFGGIGICHLFVDDQVDAERAMAVIYNAKTQRPAVCNALDTLLVHSAIAEKFVPQLIELLAKAGVSFRLDKKAFALAAPLQHEQKTTIQLAHQRDWNTEWLSLTLSIKIVDHMGAAIEHIHQHSSGHSDGILTENRENAQYFCQHVDSAAVYVNASTRFTDGGQLGLGSEVAISTQKIHARGPMGLQELTSYKWVIEGDYHVRK